MSGPRVVCVCRSERRRTRKQQVSEGMLIQNWGLEGDAHAGRWHRQVSLLGDESYEMARKLWHLDVSHGGFAENLTTRRIDLKSLPVGTRLEVAAEALLEVTQIGKKCHNGCEIMQLTGKCVFPEEGVCSGLGSSAQATRFEFCVPPDRGRCPRTEPASGPRRVSWSAAGGPGSRG